MSTPPAFSSFLLPTRLHMGRGALAQLVPELQRLGSRRPFLVVDPGVREGALLDQVRSLLQQAGLPWSSFSEIESDPSADTVQQAWSACQAHAGDAIVAVGGGSAIDVAKAVAIVATNGGSILDYEGIEKFAQRPLPRVAIPTTAGTGSEVSGSCVITDTRRQLKASVRHASLNPADAALLDPLAVRTLPAHVAAHAGVDAFVHAFEGYLSRGANPVTDALNLHAMGLLSRNIRRFVADRTDADAALAMLCGSALAGCAFGITGLGNVHCMARFVGAFCHVSHGLANAVCLPHVARFNLPANPARFADVARAMGADTSGMDEQQAAAQAIHAIDALCADLGIPPGLAAIGARPEQLEEMARLSAEAGYNRWNPRFTTLEDFRGLFRQAF